MIRCVGQGLLSAPFSCVARITACIRHHTGGGARPLAGAAITAKVVHCTIASEITGRAGRNACLRKVRLILSEGILTDRRVRTAAEHITRVALGYRNAVRICLAGLVVTRCLDKLYVRVRAVAGLVGDASVVRAAIDRVRGRREGVAVLRTRTYRHIITKSRVPSLIRSTAATSRCEY